MTNQELYDFIARFDASGLRKLKLSQGDFQIELEKAAPAAAVPVLAPAAPAAPKAEEAPAGGHLLRRALPGAAALCHGG